MKKFIVIVGFFLFLGYGCKNYLDIVPEDDINTISTVFEQRNQVVDWVETCYSWLPSIASVPTNIGLTGADEFAASDFLRLNVQYPLQALTIGDGQQSASSPVLGKWENTSYYAAIRYCNTFFEHIEETRNMTDEEKAQWTAEVKAVKAFYYFELIRMYGPIVLMPQNIGVDTDVKNMKFPRSHVDTCFKAVVDLLDEAIPVLYTRNQKELSRRGYFTKEAALALKAKVLVYQASPLFNGCEYYANFTNKNGEPLFNATEDLERWRVAAEACEEAIRVCEQNGWMLVQGNADKKTTLLNVMADIEHSVQMPGFETTEIIFQAKYPNTYMTSDNHLYKYVLPRVENNYNHFNDALYGCLSPTLKMVEMFYTENGLPIDMDKTWSYQDRYQMGRENDMTTYEDVIPENTDVLNLHLRREPRFYADIAADRTYWQRGPEPVNPWDSPSNLLVEAYAGEPFGTIYSSIMSTAPQNISGYYCKKGTFSDIGTRDYQNDVSSMADMPLPLIRLAELYLMAAEAWNEYLPAPDKRVYDNIDMVRERAGILPVREAWEQYSTNPVLVTTKEGMRDIIRQEFNIEFAFEGQRFWNLRRWQIAHEELNEPLYGWNVLGKDADSFYNHGEPVVVWSKRGFSAPRDYFWPIRGEEAQVSGVVQNPGW